jgi:hypothetical protein
MMVMGIRVSATNEFEGRFKKKKTFLSGNNLVSFKHLTILLLNALKITRKVIKFSKPPSLKS